MLLALFLLHLKMNWIPRTLILLSFISCTQEKPAVQKELTDSINSQKINSAAPAVVLEKDPIALIRQKVGEINTMNLEKKHFEFTCDEKMMVC